MNVMDFYGYTPFLSYLNYLCSNSQSFFQQIYSYIIFKIKTIKYQGRQDFSLEALDLTYENYTENNNGVGPQDIFINNIYLLPEDVKYAEKCAFEEFEKTYVDVLIGVLKAFVSLGANPCLTVGKLQSIREPKLTDDLLGVPKSSEEAYQVSLPAKLQKHAPQRIMQQKEQKQVEYCKDGENNAWHFVASNPIRKVVEYLQTLNIPMDNGNYLGNTPFMKLMLTNILNKPYMSFEEMYNVFKLYKVNIDKPNNKGTTPFLQMMKNNNQFRALKLATEGANVNATDKYKNFALRYSVSNNDVACTKELLYKYKADPDQRDNKQRNCLHIAINNSSPTIDSTSDMENLLLDSGADINAIDIRGRSPLHYAFVKIGKWNDCSTIDPIEAVTTLCSKIEIDVDVQDKWGKTPLHYAAQRSSTICTVFLLNRGATLEAKDIYGNSPLACAFLYSHPDYAITLIERNADVTQQVFPEDPSKFPDTEEKKAESEDENSAEDPEIMEPQFFGQKRKMFSKKRKVAKNGFGFRNKFRKQNNFGFIQNQFGHPQQQYNATGLNMSKTVSESPQSMFRIAIRMGWQGLLYLLLDKNYDYMLML